MSSGRVARAGRYAAPGSARLRRPRLGGARLGRPGLGGARLRRPRLGGARLGGARLGGARLGGARLRRAGLGLLADRGIVRAPGTAGDGRPVGRWRELVAGWQAGRPVRTGAAWRVPWPQQAAVGSAAAAGDA
ncbi:pentapeptide repeat-containing protein [Nonomuraea sp. NPDC049480]|uniref:pentapeptide repeat-containing protein n=1 Tax=Nonomuraea sp. NPDC049480 TaxID=3364353 RepID=UPI0037B9EFF0